MQRLIIIVLVFIILDCVTGILQACKNKELNSTKMRNGFFNKVAFIMVMCLAIICDYTMLFIDIGLNIHLLKVVSIYIVTTEIISILENIGKMNPNILQEMSKYTYDTFSNTNLYKRQDLKSWLKEGTLPVKKNFQNFLFSKDGLIIYFPRYQIGPYYYGDKNILIPYNKLHLNI